MKRNALKYSIRIRDNRSRLSLNCISKFTKETISINIYKCKDGYLEPDFILEFNHKNSKNNTIFKGILCIYNFDNDKYLINEIRKFINGSGYIVDTRIKHYINNNLKRLRRCHTRKEFM